MTKNRGFEISCVVTTRNRPEYLEEAVQSLVEQEDPGDYEILIVDDASDDGATWDMALDLAERHKQVAAMRLVTRRGPGGARNEGNRVARGQIIVVQDSDDISTPLRVRAIREFFNKNPRTDVFFSGGWRTDKNLENREYHSASLYQVDILEGRQLIWHPTMAYTKALAMNITYPEDMADVDYGWLLTAKQRGAKFGCLDRGLVLYRGHPDQISRAKFGLQQELAQEKRRNL